MKHLLLLVAAIALNVTARADESPTPRSAADPRHTPAVEVFQRYKDAVVYLTGPMAGPRESAIEEFFVLPHRREVTSLGTGFIIHPSGYILANAHAVERPYFHQVTLSSGLKLPAELLAVVREHDLALLKVDFPHPLTAVTFARSNDLLVGEPVIVIANPAGLRLTCTTGVLSAVGRATVAIGLPGVVLHGLIQTDAAINPGSSGGPWFNALGQVIGITSAQKRDSENIAFGIPVEAIRQALPDMLDVERRQLIVTGLQFRQDDSPRVADVAPDSPAAAAGIKRSDILVKLDGKPIAGRLDISFALIGHKPGETVPVQVSRDGQTLQFSLKLGKRPKPDGAALLKAKFGLTAVPLDKARADAASLRVRRGVLITEVAKGRPWNYDAVHSPPQPGDILAKIDSIRPRDIDDVGLLLDRLPPKKKTVLVLLRRTDKTVTRIDITMTAAE